MSGRAKNVLTSEEAARALARELHEAIKDGRRVQREINEAVIEWSDHAAEMMTRANAAMDNTTENIIGQLQEVNDLVKKHADDLTRVHAEVLGMQTPEEVMRLIAINLTEILQPVVLKFVAEQLPAVVIAEMDEIAAKGTAKYGKTMRQIIAIADTTIRTQE